MEYTDGTLKYNAISLANKSGGTPWYDNRLFRHV